jgi:hypothetical protein
MNKMLDLVGELQKVIFHRCILEGCVYGYEEVHKEPGKVCIYCRNPRPKGVSRNAWRSPGKSVEDMLETKKQNELINQKNGQK